jgi:hypothetical protein
MNEQNPIYITTEMIDKLENKYGWNDKYKKLRNDETVKIDGKYYKKSPFNGASK